MDSKCFNLWTNSETPKSLAEIIGNTELICTIQKYLANQNIPNMLIVGLNGTGKNTIVNLLVKEYLQEHYPKALLDIDGSIYRGKDVITNSNDSKKTDKSCVECGNVMVFAKNRMSINKKKLVVIRNFDHMTKEAQSALRRLIETHAKTTRFILIANNLDDVIEAIQSRCVILKTSQFNDEEMTLIMQNIASRYGRAIPDEIYRIICLLSEGDLKKALNYLQVISNAPDTNSETFYGIFNIPSVHNIKKIIEYCNTNASEAYRLMNEFLENGYNSTDILDVFISTLVRYEDISLEQKMYFLKCLTKCYYQTEINRADNYLFGLIANLCSFKPET